ncbi:plasmid mobilization relaxosome protein MobC [Bacillus sp. FSL R12-0069]|uniref:plasmid mobilization relaxosome protein MobC n=1 Tax=Bacillus sp. FSL R12-0069 TaxID=2975342 RepID=UPI004046DDEF
MRQTIARNLSQMGNNMNQISKYCHTHKKGNIDWEHLNYNIEKLRKELWQQLN